MKGSSQAEKPQRKGHPALVGGLLVLGTIITLLAIFSIWANRQALNTDNWVSTADRILANKQIDERLSNYISEQVFANVEVEAKLEEALPPKLSPLAGALAGGLHQLAPKVSERVLESPKFQALWDEANRHAHEALLKVLNGEEGTISTANGTVTLNLGPLVEQVAEQVGASGISEKLPEGAGSITILHSNELSLAQKGAKLVRHLPIVLTLVALLLFAAAIGLAGPRRRQALRSVGIGFVVAGVLALLLRTLGGHYLTDALAQTDTAKPAIEAVWGIGTSLLVTVASSAIAFGVLVFIAAWLAGPTGLATSLRREAAPYVRNQPLAVWAAAIVVFIILVAWAPVVAFQKPLGMLLLALLIAFGTELLRRQILREFPDAAPGEVGARTKAWANGVFSGRGGSGSDDPAAGRVADLERLSKLHKEGSLDDAEFAEAKTAILGPKPEGT